MYNVLTDQFIGQACEAASGQACSQVSAMRERTTVERRCLCALTAPAQERRDPENGQRRL